MTNGIRLTCVLTAFAVLSFSACKKLPEDSNERSQVSQTTSNQVNGMGANTGNLASQTNMSDFGSDEFSALSLGLTKSEKDALKKAGQNAWLLAKMKVDGGGPSCELWDVRFTLSSPSATPTATSTPTATPTTSSTGTETNVDVTSTDSSTSTDMTTSQNIDNFVYLEAKKIEKRQDDAAGVIDYLGGEKTAEGSSGVAAFARFKTYGKRDFAYYLMKPGQTYLATVTKSDRCHIKVDKKEVSNATFTPSGKQKIEIYDAKFHRGVTLFVKPM